MMEVSTKYEINDLVRHKYSIDKETEVRLMEVMSITTETCYAGTQVFYFCRPIVAMRAYSHHKKDFEWQVSHGIGKTFGQPEWQKYREDEIKPCEESDRFLINGRLFNPQEDEG